MMLAIKVYMVRTDDYAAVWSDGGRVVKDEEEEEKESGQVGIFLQEKEGNEIRVSDSAPRIIAPSVRGGIRRDSDDLVEEEASNENLSELTESKELQRDDSDADIQQQKALESEASDKSADDKRSKIKNDAKVSKPEIDKRKAVTPAVLVKMVFDNQSCNQTGLEIPTVAVNYRYGSAAIRGSSLDTLDLVVDVYRECAADLHLLANLDIEQDNNEALLDRRKQEVKYYFLQRHVPKNKILQQEPSQ